MDDVARGEDQLDALAGRDVRLVRVDDVLLGVADLPPVLVAHDLDPQRAVTDLVISVEDPSASIWLWHREDGDWAIEKIISIPAEPADPDRLPPALKPFAAVPPIVSDLVLPDGIR
ncbi:MAG: hypothetical protein ACRD0K_04850 [Egibacteraceae bacterium]